MVAEDLVGVTEVEALVQRLGGSEMVIRMDRVEGNALSGRYAGFFTAPASPDATFQTYIVRYRMRDAAGNIGINGTPDLNFTVSPTAPPSLSDHPSVMPLVLASTGGNVTLRMGAGDPSGVAFVRARIAGPGGVEQIVNLVIVEGDPQNALWGVMVVAPQNRTTTPQMYEVRFFAADTLGNQTALSPPLSFMVMAPAGPPPRPDRTAPTISGANVTPATLPSTGGQVRLQLTAKDAVGVTQAQAEITRPDSSRTTVPLTRTSGDERMGVYAATFTVPANTTGRDQKYKVQFVVMDAARNQKTANKQFTVRR